MGTTFIGLSPAVGGLRQPILRRTTRWFLKPPENDILVCYERLCHAQQARPSKRDQDDPCIPDQSYSHQAGVRSWKLFVCRIPP